MIKLVIVFSLMSVCFADVKCYLYKYGFLQAADETSLQTSNDTDVTDALLTFQEYYKLPIDGTLNDETKALMSKPRCGNTDIIANYNLTPFKWNKTVLRWNYYLANPQALELSKKAFSLWEEKSGLQFIHDRVNADIVISNRQKKHDVERTENISGFI